MRPTQAAFKTWGSFVGLMGLAGIVLGAGCSGETLRCEKPFEVWEDEDGDGYGTQSLGLACELVEGHAREPLDCDDANAEVSPGSNELCDGMDNDCDGVQDNGFELKQFFGDLDGDGFGGQFPSQLACERPDDGWVVKTGDCDDNDPLRNPNATEVCGGTDEDCDGLEGDYDDSVDIGTLETFYEDTDGDGLGDQDSVGRFCQLQAGYAPNALDCDDNAPLIGQYRYYDDVDEDTYGDPNTLVLACLAPVGMVQNNLDCDDGDPAINIDKRWYLDEDLDGYGSGVPTAYQCIPPSLDARLDHDDCNDGDPNIHPGAPDICLDGEDGDCNGTDACRTCLEQFIAVPTSTNGVYSIAPDGNIDREVYCDMTTDGGGWTLVGSTVYPLSDVKGGFHNELDTINPTGYHTGVWWELRDITLAHADMRFACKRPTTEPNMTVDLSFYDVGWYYEITSSYYDYDTCFSQSDGAGADPPPARRNNLTGDFLPAGDQWGAGYLEGENYCSSYSDFTVDFDDRGMDSNESDGTDWGMDTYTQKCGTAGGGSAQWFIFVREL